MAEPEPYPAWVQGVVVADAEEAEAVREGRAILETVKSAAGDTVFLVGIKPRDEPVQPEPVNVKPESAKGKATSKKGLG